MNNNNKGKRNKSKGQGKERRAQLKAEKAKDAAARLLVKQANEIPDPLAKFPTFTKFERNGLNCKLECKRVNDLVPEVLEWAITLCQTNMQPLYEQSQRGWRANEKREEMTEEEAWYLIAYDVNLDKPIGFSHFRFDMDYGDEVLYCYELQLEPEYRGKGLGRFLLQVLELMAFSNQMVKVVLTVFKHNPRGLSFFKKCRYDIDETSPEDDIDDPVDYRILSKLNKMKPTQKTSL
ncbi:N-alpha-acetyltransferase 40 [Macrobrachium rosenbergii]|uniref:N-alpha-acetyltransferase 40 n=1 Tax=Macrobrachium rosenbergii TaxID=79674 RepID=UPI0034D53108